MTYVDVVLRVKYMFLLLLSFVIHQEATSPGFCWLQGYMHG